MKNDLRFVILVSIILLLYPASASTNTKEQLPFKLLATVLGTDSAESTCVLMNLESARSSAFKVGDKILDYQIAIITRASVTLLKDGKFSFLNFPFGSENKPLRGGSGIFKIQRRAFKKKIPDFNSLLNQVSPIPFVESGRVTGFEVPQIKNKALQYILNMAGLKEGDVATSINGERIISLQKALELYDKFKNQEKIEVEIKRGGTLKNLTYYIN